MKDNMKTEYKKNNIAKINRANSIDLIRELKPGVAPYLVLYHKGEALYPKNGS
jgi:hypothetical protein